MDAVMLNKDLARSLIEELTPHMNVGERITKVSLASRILGSLKFFAQGSYQISVGNESKVGIIGCVDGTHVAIVTPVHDEHLYYNRKRYHSKNVQIICDANLQIINVNANFGGASHDAFIWQNSAIKQHLQENYQGGDRVTITHGYLAIVVTRKNLG
ncbi:hypothetical protein NQ315_014229 [Exocentrus adspersus]|uniref:DDE Tnp4 domain-containing protein n=1 Tax=Exocentrus adspersus TaxID=1586481 RepID=A0AAV8VCC1_9CUCU|nr:hypothetical protein NQ315_014229 [Exocentrus adspersus]